MREFDDARRSRRSPVPTGAERAPTRDSLLALQRAAGNRAVLARLKLSNIGGVYARDDAAGTVETRELDKVQRRALVVALTNAGNAALLAQVQADWRAQREAKHLQATAAPDIAPLAELIALGERVAAVEQEAAKRGGYKQVPGKDKEEVDRSVRALKTFVDKLDDEEDPTPDPGGVLRDAVHALFARVTKLTGAKDLTNYGIPLELAQPVTAQDILDYRADTQEMGVFAGPAEAEAVAQALHVQFDIFVVVNGRFRRAYPNIGANQVRTGRSLLFLGNHYVVLQQNDLVEGEPVPAHFPVVAATETRGDCLYEGIYIVSTGHKPANYDESIKHLRLLASAGMSDVAVETSIMLIRSGSRHGVGTRMSRTLQDAGLRHLIATLKERDKDAYAKHEDEIDRMFKAYDSALKRATEDDEPPWERGVLEEKLAAVAAEIMPEEEEENPLSVPKTLFRWVSTEGGKAALKEGITFDPEGGGIPTSTKGAKGIAIQSGAVSLNVLLRIDTKLIPDFKFEYVPTRGTLKEVKIKCDVPAEAISKG